MSVGFVRLSNSLHRSLQLFVRHNHFDLDIRHELNGVFTAAIDYGLANPTAKSFDLGGCHSIDPQFTQGIFDFFKPERFDDGLNLLYVYFTASFNRSDALAVH